MLAGSILAAPLRAQNLNSINRELTDIDGEVTSLLQVPLRSDQMRSATFVEERLTDGELFFRLNDYLRASIIFTDLVENYSSHPVFPDALYLLAESLFQAGDYLGARTRFDQLLHNANDQGFRPFVQRALARSIEIAIRVRDFTNIEAHFAQLDRLAASDLEAPTAYFRAKYLYNRAVPESVVDAPADERMGLVDVATLERARAGFAAIPVASQYGLQARYFVGTIHALRSEYDQAIAAFQQVLGGRPETLSADQRQVIELTLLALGRIYYEVARLEKAVEAYSAVPSTSPRFPAALYELGWTYIQMGSTTQAERALEVLEVAAPQSPLIPDAKILRGNLLQRNGRYADAKQSFVQVREEFSAIRGDFDRVRAEHSDLPAYFRRLVRANMDDFDINDFVPESAQQWVQLEGDHSRALGVLKDLSDAKRLVGETESLISRIKAALAISNRAAVFSDLRLQAERSTGLRNRLTKVRGELAAREAKLGEGGPTELSRVRAERKALAAQLQALPVEDEDFILRDEAVLDRFRALDLELQKLDIEVLGLEARIVAAETVLRRQGSSKQVAELVGQLKGHKADMVRFRKELSALRDGLEVGRVQIGVGDNRYQQDAQRRERLAALVARERELAGSQGGGFDSAYQRVQEIESRLDARDAEVETVVAARVARMLGVVDEESRNVVGYRGDLKRLEGETEVVVGEVTHRNFNLVRERFHNIVLRADLGLIDVSWARREEHRKRIDLVTRERARELQVLDDEFRDVMDEDLDYGGGER